MCTNHHNDDHHLELGLAESRAATEVTTWDKWIDEVERQLGHSIDGTQWIDGYCMDEAFDAWRGDRHVEGSGWSVAEYVAKVNRDKAAVAAGEYITQLNSKEMSRRDDDGEESRWDEVTLYVGKATDAYLEEYVAEHYPSEHCQHEYDCCGRWYANRARIKRHGELAVLKQSYTQNI